MVACRWSPSLHFVCVLLRFRPSLICKYVDPPPSPSAFDLARFPQLELARPGSAKRDDADAISSEKETTLVVVNNFYFAQQ